MSRTKLLPLFFTLFALTTTQATQASDWNGLYLGGMVSYDQFSIDMKGSEDIKALTHNFTDSLFNGGNVYAGYNVTFSNVLVGIEGDIGYQGTSTSTKAFSGGDLISLDVKNKFSAGIRGRLGVTYGSFLLYGTAGVAYSNLSVDFKTTLDGVSSSLSKKDNVTGLSVGAGAEFMLFNSLVLRAEYLYTDFDALDFSLNDDFGSYDSANHDIRIGVALKF